MHRLLKERYPEAVSPLVKGDLEIKAVDHKSSPPVHLMANVSQEDGVPWSVNVTYLLLETLSEEVLTALADKMGLITSTNRPLFYIGRMHPLASFWPDELVLQISFLNLPPDRVINFLTKVEELLST